MYNGRILLTGGDLIYKKILPILRKSASSKYTGISCMLSNSSNFVNV